MAYIRFVPQVPVDRDCLLFYKIPQIAARATTDDVARSHNGGGGDVAQLGMLSLEGGLVKSMYSSVARVFAPHNGRVSWFCCVVGFIDIQLRLRLRLLQVEMKNHICPSCRLYMVLKTKHQYQLTRLTQHVEFPVDRLQFGLVALVRFCNRQTKRNTNTITSNVTTTNQTLNTH